MALSGSLAACSGASPSADGADVASAGPATGTMPGAGVGAPGGGATGATPGVGAGAGVTAPPGGLDGGAVVLRRLNRTEYNNTVRDLLGSSLRPADAFPADDISVEGFDTVGLALNFTTLHGEQAEAATVALVDELLARPAGDPIRDRILVCDVAGEGEACVSDILSGFMRRAFRRPVDANEVGDFAQVAADIQLAGGTAEEGLGAALRAVLLSPDFLFRVELDLDPTSATPHLINDYELATRLSYFLWSSTPDDALLDAAESGALTTDPTELDRQFERLMSDPRSNAVLTSLAAQWLSLRRIDEVAPAADVFPSFDESLRQAMRQETELFFENLVREDAPLETLLLADYTYADARLATHYGLADSPDSMTRVSLTGTARTGLLSQASFLSVTSFPNRTSPVNRGAWVLEEMLCTQPPPPPPNVATALAPPTPAEATTLRQKFELHRADPACAACHMLFDPLGFGLENFDAIGAYRTTDNDQPIDASGVISNQAFNGVTELANIVTSDSRFVSCMVEQLMTYGIGRSFREASAKGYIAGLGENVRALGATWQTALRTVVTSEAFQSRRAGER